MIYLFGPLRLQEHGHNVLYRQSNHIRNSSAQLSHSHLSVALPVVPTFVWHNKPLTQCVFPITRGYLDGNIRYHYRRR